MNKKQVSRIVTSVTISFLVVITILQQNRLQAYLYPPPPPGNDYNHWKAGWDQAEVDAYYDAYKGKYRDYLSGADCQGHTEAYCHGYMAGYQDYVDRNSHHLVDQQNVDENNGNIRALLLPL